MTAGYLDTYMIITKSSKSDFEMIFNYYNKNCFEIFYKHILVLDWCNGLWICSLVDHLTGFLCQLAILADSNQNENQVPEVVDNEDSSEIVENEGNKNVNQAIMIIKDKLNPLLKSNDPKIDSKNFA